MNEELLRALGINVEQAKEQALNRGILGGILNLAAMSGPQARPVGTAQGLAQAVMGGMGAYESSFDKTLRDALTGIQLQEMQRNRARQESGRAALQRAYERLSGITPEGALAAPGGQVGPTVERAAMVGQRQPMTQQELLGLAINPNIDPESSKRLVEMAQLTAPKAGPGVVGEYQAAIAAGLIPRDMSLQDYISQVKKPLVQNIVGGEVSPFVKKAQELQAQEFSNISNSGNNARRTLQDVNKLGTLLEKTGGGFVPALKQIAGEYGIETKGLNDIQAAQAIINRLVPQQRPPGSGTMSDADLILFKQSLPRIINQPGGNKTIVDTLKNINNYLVEEGKIATDVLNNKISPQEGYDRLNKLANPLEAFKATGGGSLQERINAELARRQGAR